MTWVRQMQKDMVAIAFPDWEWNDEDVVEVTMDYDPGIHSEVTFDPSWFEITITVSNDAHRRRATSRIMNEDATEFWRLLMERGSQ